MCRIRTLWQLALAAALTVGSVACGDDNNRSRSRAGQVYLAWDVGYLPATDPNGPLTPASCDAVGATSVRMDAYDSAQTLVASKTWPCRDGQGTSDDLAPGNYFIGVTLLNDKNESMANTDPGEAVAQVRGGLAWDFGQRVEFALQSLPLSWELYRGTQRVLCGEAGASKVLLIAATEVSGSIMEMQKELNCTDTPTVSPPVSVGVTYKVILRLLDAQGALMAEASQFVTTPLAVRATLAPFKFNLK